MSTVWEARVLKQRPRCAHEANMGKCGGCVSRNEIGARLPAKQTLTVLIAFPQPCDFPARQGSASGNLHVSFLPLQNLF